MPNTDLYIKTASTIGDGNVLPMPDIPRGSGFFIEVDGIGPGNPIQYGVSTKDLLIDAVELNGKILACDPDGTAYESARTVAEPETPPAPHAILTPTRMRAQLFFPRTC